MLHGTLLFHYKMKAKISKDNIIGNKFFPHLLRAIPRLHLERLFPCKALLIKKSSERACESPFLITENSVKRSRMFSFEAGSDSVA